MQVLGERKRGEALAEEETRLAAECGGLESLDGRGQAPVSQSTGEELDLLVENGKGHCRIPVPEEPGNRRETRRQTAEPDDGQDRRQVHGKEQLP